MGNKKLIVEGNDDKHVVFAIRDQFSIPENFEVDFLKDKKQEATPTGGIEKMLKLLPLELREEGTDTLGIIVDEDFDAFTRWMKIKNLFEKFGYTLPDRPDLNGVIIEHSDKTTIYPIKLGIWLMPDNNLQGGKIEDFLKSLVHQDNELIKISYECIAKVKQIDENKRFKNKDESKALIHNWLSLQNPPGKPFGQAITSNFFDNDAELIKRFANWLKNLFNE
jgi:hypothetical protein